jgi:hypothetical protein
VHYLEFDKTNKANQPFPGIGGAANWKRLLIETEFHNFVEYKNDKDE